MYNEIQTYKQMGYTIRSCARAIDYDRKTVRKYWNMAQDEYVRYMAGCRERTKILDAYRGEITVLLEMYPNITAAIVNDRLMANHENFKPSYRSVRAYVTALREELGMPTYSKIRQYSEVAELPLGFQAQADMGQKVMPDPFGKNVRIYIFAMVMSHSRKKFVYFQDHPFSAKEFIEAHDLAFRCYGGRTQEIVYDQDRVVAVSENAGDLIFTDTFDAYRKYAGFSVRLCRGFDPESKGKIESTVKYVKGNFLACRTYCGISALNSEAMAWLDRTANAKIHETTKMIPNVVFAEEIRHLKPVPTLSKPIAPKTAIVRKTNVVHYKQNRYEVPKGTYFPGREASISVDMGNGTVSFCDKETGEFLAKHTIESNAVGKLVRLPKNVCRNGNDKLDELKIKVLEAFPEMVSYIEKLIVKYPRYTSEQLRIILKCTEQYSESALSNALEYCASKDLISANDFRDTLEFFRADEQKIIPKPVLLPEKYQMVQAAVRSLDSYIPTAMGGDSI